jgi:hypothetical protein
VGTVRTAQATAQGTPLAATWAHRGPRVGQGLPQTTRRVLQGDAVPAAEQLVRLFAPPTAMIRQGPPGRPTAFGRVRWVEAVEGGSIRRDAVLAGHPAADAPLPPRRDHPRRGCKRPPRLLAGDRGMHSTANER